MALVLAMQEGRSIYVGDTEVVVESVQSASRVKVRVKGPLDTLHTLTLNNRTEILPTVYLQLGTGSTPTMVKLVIEAPKHITILRDSLYEVDKGSK